MRFLNSFVPGINQVPVQEQSLPSEPSASTLMLKVANREYSLELPENCKRFRFQLRSNFDLRFAFKAGRVAKPMDPYLTLKRGCQYDSGPLIGISGSLFFADATSNTIVEIEAWI